MDSLESDSQTQFNYWDHLYNQQDNFKTSKVSFLAENLSLH